MTAPHAVRWLRRIVRGLDDYTRWHQTTNAHTTACGRRIPTMATSMLPETDDDLARVDCRRCKAARE